MESLMTFLECIFDCIPHREAIHGNPWQSMAITGHQRPSAVISSNQRSSAAIRGHSAATPAARTCPDEVAQLFLRDVRLLEPKRKVLLLMRQAIRGHQRSSEVIRGHQSSIW